MTLSTNYQSAAPADSDPNNWVDRFAPAWIIPWLRMMRADRPIGVWLLALPCLYGMGLALQTTPLSLLTILALGLLFFIGAFVMRSAGCVYNDILDRDIDAKVARTALRPIPSGQISVSGAIILLGLLMLAGLIILLQLNQTTIMLGVASLVLVAAYPLMKRITWWPQVWLGLTFNWGVLVGYAAVTGTLSPASILLYGACLFWTVGYDTIYAHQDREDDALIGVRSTARRLGDHSRRWVAIYYGSTLTLFAAALWLSGFPLSSIFGLGFAAIHFTWQIIKMDINSAHKMLNLFKSNRNAGLLLLAPFLMTAIWL